MPSDPLAILGSSWLGRDADANVKVTQPSIANIEALTEAPRHYGFHCTLRPPMRIATSWREFHTAACRVAAATAPFPLPPLEVALIDGFLAVTLSQPSVAMQELADFCVRATNAHRQPPSAEELARRRAANLTARQAELLQTWGYPYVMQEWRFHMTLTRGLSHSEQDLVMPPAARHFASALSVPRLIDHVCIFTEDGGDFVTACRLPLAGKI